VKVPAEEREQLVDELKVTLHSGFTSEEVEQGGAAVHREKVHGETRVVESDPFPDDG
jgi:hypothetical protein